MALGMLLALLGCAAFPWGRGVSIHTGPTPSLEERYCAWFGDEQGGVLYFGQAAFWSTMRTAGGDPMADLEHEGPVWIGRFDLDERRMLPALVVAERARSGVWDVLAHQNGWIYFTTFYEPAGRVDLATGRVVRFEEAGLGLNELARGPDGRILVTRYGEAGSVVVLDPEGRVTDEFPLERADRRAAAKSVAYDPVREEIWVNTDLFGEPGEPVEHDARVLDRGGRELWRSREPEIQFMTFDPQGGGYLAERSGTRLWLRRLAPGEDGRSPGAGRLIPLDERFPLSLDFVQEIHITPDGGAVVTRWSGRIHVVDPRGGVRTLDRPEAAPAGLFYTGVLHGDLLCATVCSDAVTVACQQVR